MHALQRVEEAGQCELESRCGFESVCLRVLGLEADNCLKKARNTNTWRVDAHKLSSASSRRGFAGASVTPALTLTSA